MAATPLKLFASFATFCSKNEKDWNRSKQREQRQIHRHFPLLPLRLLLLKIGGLDRRTGNSIHPSDYQLKRTGKYLLKYS